MSRHVLVRRRTPVSRVKVAVAALLASVLLVTVSPQAASASTSTSLPGGPAPMTLAGFTPGNIISDSVFTAKDTMTEQQIQQFFNGKVSSCRGGSDKYGPIICLKDYAASTVTRPADRYCNGYTGSGSESAARIIHRVAQSCGINPQVLIVMLQKEQGLVTHSWPSAWRYDKALGQGCPDNAPCNPAYVGFFYQIYGAARQMKIYMEGVYFTYYAPGRTWNIRYNPEVECGSAPVTVANKATSALYYYTPYQPNAAALRAGYGEGDACSAYGNRNFYNYFTDWFGSTQTLPVVPPPAPPVPLQPINTSNHLLAVDTGGRLMAYPFSKGNWGAPQQLGVGFDRRSIYGVGDFDGDGNRDALDVRDNGSLDLVLGTGSGYSTVRALPQSFSGSALVASAGDFDGDGIADMFTTGVDGTLRLHRGDGAGGLRPPLTVGAGWNIMNMIVGGSDLSGDGHADLLARRSDGALWVYFGDGRGGWAGSAQLGTGWNGMTTIVIPGDFDGDGLPDILARDGSGGLWLYSGQPGARIAGRGQIGVGWNIMTSMSGPGAAVSKPRPLGPGTDIDRDGEPDVLAQSASGSLVAYRGDGKGGWKGTSTLRTDWGDQKRLIPLGDFDGDQWADVASIDSSGRLMLWSGDGKGALQAARQIGQGWDRTATVVGRIDFDADRRRDILMRDAGGALLLYRGDGRGGLAGSGQRIGVGWGIFDQVLSAGDFDGDGRSDLIARRADDGALWLYPTDGAGGWQAPREIGTGWGQMTALLSVGDFDGDGASDLIARTATGDLFLYRGDGRGGWRGSKKIGVGWASFSALG